MDNGFRAYLIRVLNEGKRLDRPTPLDFRQVKIEYGVSATAEGSAKVTLGNTVLIAGVKLELGTPYPDQPDQGTIQIGAELVPLSSPDFESGPPSIMAVELARVVDRGIRESKALDLKKLCVKPKEESWTVIVDVVTLNDDGNLIDASGLAVLAALNDARFPLLENGVVDYKKKTDKKIELSKQPLPVTVYKIQDHFFVDPTREEERVADARLTVASTEDGKLCALQKGGDAPLTTEDISKMIDIAKEKAAQLRGFL